tara:strand:+ start:4381 stop:4653 length:273 start_codon:yes stop_codon:yes gene_type:complete
MNLSNDILHNQIVTAPLGNAYSNTVDSCMKNFMSEQSSFGKNMSGGSPLNLKKQKKIVFEILKILSKSYSKNKKINIREVMNKKTKKKSK